MPYDSSWGGLNASQRMPLTVKDLIFPSLFFFLSASFFLLLSILQRYACVWEKVSLHAFSFCMSSLLPESFTTALGQIQSHLSHIYLIELNKESCLFAVHLELWHSKRDYLKVVIMIYLPPPATTLPSTVCLRKTLLTGFTVGVSRCFRPEIGCMSQWYCYLLKIHAQNNVPVHFWVTALQFHGS